MTIKEKEFEKFRKLRDRLIEITDRYFMRSVPSRTYSLQIKFDTPDHLDRMPSNVTSDKYWMLIDCQANDKSLTDYILGDSFSEVMTKLEVRVTSWQIELSNMFPGKKINV